MNQAPGRSLTTEDNISGPLPGEPATEEEAMHPVIIEAVAAQRNRELQEQATAGRRARQIRRTQAGPSRARRPILRIPLRIARAV